MSNKTWEKRIDIDKDAIEYHNNVFRDRAGYYKLEEVEPVRWVWGAIYKPTDAQIAAAEEATERKKQELQDELVRVSDMAEDDMPNKAKRMEEIKTEMQIPVEPEQDEIRQYDPDGTFHSITDVDLDRVDKFVMHRWDDITERVIVPVRENMKIFHVYKNFHDMRWNDANTTARVFCFGFEMEDLNRSVYYYILPDDTVILSDSPDIDLAQYNLIDPQNYEAKK